VAQTAPAPRPRLPRLLHPLRPQPVSANNSPIVLSRPLVNQLLTEAQKSPNVEVCGLVGKSSIGSHCYPITNVAEDPTHQFLLDGAEQVEAMRKMRERGEKPYAIYHSHPTAPAYPSATDQRLAAYPDYLYLIISLDITGVLQIRGFQLRGEQIDEIALEI